MSTTTRALELPHRLRLTVPALCACAVAIGSVLGCQQEAADVARSLPAVPAATLAKAERLAAMPATPREPSEERSAEKLAEFASRLLRTIPYPPERTDELLLDLVAQQTRASGMSRISSDRDVRIQAEFRAACTWTSYWLDAQDADDGAALKSATTVLRSVPQWPSIENSGITTSMSLLAQAAESGDSRPLREEVDGNCPS